MSDLFIPKKIRVGYQTRTGTYTGRLAYVIYYDNKDVLRKEKSWESWRDKKIEPEEFNNDPQDGFCLNKDVKRFNWSHFGSNRSYIRMYDPRGIEFEVTPENLIGILTETDCLKRGLEGKFVYAWKGTELVLLPCGSEEFTKAKIHTERQDQNISARDLKPGCSYTTKKGEEFIYVGRFPWYEWDTYHNKPRKATRQHIFCNSQKATHGWGFFYKSDVKFLAMLNSPDAVLNYAEIVDEWSRDIRSSSVDKWEYKPETCSMEDVFGSAESQKKHPYFKRNDFIEISGDILEFWSFNGQIQYGREEVKYYMSKNGSLNTTSMIYSRPTYDYYSYSGSQKYNSQEEIFNRVKNSVKVTAILSNGKKVSVKTIGDICR